MDLSVKGVILKFLRRNSKWAAPVVAAILTGLLIFVLSKSDFKKDYPKSGNPQDLIFDKVSLGKFPRSEDPQKRAEIVTAGSGWFSPARGPSEKALVSAGQDFSILFERQKAFLLTAKDGKKRPLSPNPVLWVFISPNEQYLGIDPLTLIDIDAWTSYDFAGALKTLGLIQVHLWSIDGKSLIFSETECAVDCPETSTYEFWKVNLK